MKQEVSEKVTEKDFLELALNTDFNYSTEIEVANSFFHLAQKMVAQSLQPNIVGEGEKVFRKVSVKERLPEKGVYVCTLVEDAHGTSQPFRNYLMTYKSEPHWFDHNNSVTHWLEETSLPIQPLQNGKSIEECKDEVSKELGYKNYYDFKERVINGALMPDEVDEFIDKVSQLYASQHPLQNGRWYTKEQMKQMAIQISDWKDGYTGKSDNRDLHTVVNDFLSSITPAPTENEAVEFAKWTQQQFSLCILDEYDLNNVKYEGRIISFNELYTIFQSTQQPLKK